MVSYLLPKRELRYLLVHMHLDMSCTIIHTSTLTVHHPQHIHLSICVHPHHSFIYPGSDPHLHLSIHSCYILLPKYFISKPSLHLTFVPFASKPFTYTCSPLPLPPSPLPVLSCPSQNTAALLSRPHHVRTCTPHGPKNLCSPGCPRQP